MSVDEAVAEAIGRYLRAYEYVPKDDVKEIAETIAKEVYEKFRVEIEETKSEIDKLRKRNDRMWDMINQIPTPKFGWFWRLVDWVSFWRK